MTVIIYTMNHVHKYTVKNDDDDDGWSVLSFK